MANLKLSVVPAKILVDGRHKIRIALAHAARTRYITTDCIIEDLSQFKNRQVISRADAAAMNVKLRKLLNHYQEAFDNIYDTSIYTCQELLQLAMRKKDYANIYFSSVLNEYLLELKEEKRTNSEKLYRLACQSFIRFKGDIPLTYFPDYTNRCRYSLHLPIMGLFHIIHSILTLRFFYRPLL